MAKIQNRQSYILANREAGKSQNGTYHPNINSSKDFKELQWIESISRWMDTAFVIPGTRFKFGFDPIFGLFPVVGDLVSFGISSVMILSMVKHGASRKLIILMIGNIVIDSVIGSIPILGNIFDFAFKANQRNLKLLKEHQLEGKHTGRGTGILISVAIALLLIFLLLLYGLWHLGKFVLSLF